MLIDPVIGSSPLLVAVNDGILPVPDAGKPIAGFELIQLKLTFAGVPDKLFAGIIAPSFTVVSDVVLTDPVGLTVTVNVAVAVAH